MIMVELPTRRSRLLNSNTAAGTGVSFTAACNGLSDVSIYREFIRDVGIPGETVDNAIWV